MRRLHVYERSVPRTRRDADRSLQVNPRLRPIAQALPLMIRDAEDAGLTIVANHLTRALKAAEGRSAEPFESAIDEP